MFNSYVDREDQNQCCIHNIQDNTWEVSTLLNILLFLLGSIESYLMKPGMFLNKKKPTYLKIRSHSAEVSKITKTEANVTDIGV